MFHVKHAFIELACFPGRVTGVTSRGQPIPFRGSASQQASAFEPGSTKLRRYGWMVTHVTHADGLLIVPHSGRRIRPALRSTQPWSLLSDSRAILFGIRAPARRSSDGDSDLWNDREQTGTSEMSGMSRLRQRGARGICMHPKRHLRGARALETFPDG